MRLPLLGLSGFVCAALLALCVDAPSLSAPGGPAQTKVPHARQHSPQQSQSAVRRPQVAPYRGLGTWIDLYEGRPWSHPVAAIREMESHGVSTLFVETANYGSPRAVMHRAALDRLLASAHRRGIKVVAWYLPSFRWLQVDLDRSLAAIRYRSAQGERFDGFALDIEAPLVLPISKRIERMLRLSKRIRASVRPSTSLAALVPSPYGMKKLPSYWGRLQRFPYRELVEIYDVIAPMSYFSYRVEGKRMSHDYVEFNIGSIRRLSGDDAVPLHPIGGIAKQATNPEVRGYVNAVRQGAVAGGSLYDFPSTTPGQWRELQRIPARATRGSDRRQ